MAATSESNVAKERPAGISFGDNKEESDTITAKPSYRNKQNHMF